MSEAFQIAAVAENFPLAQVFRISRGAKTQAQVVTVTITQNDQTGRGECVPYARYDETVMSVIGQIQALPAGFNPKDLPGLLPAGAARNAVDCAYWDLRAKTMAKPVWKLAGLIEPRPEITAYTLSLDTAKNMFEQALQHRKRPLLKIKLGSEDDISRLEAVRQAAPDARIIVDANEGWTPELYTELAPALLRLGVEMVEQPLPAGADDMLAEIARPLPVCADESCHDRASLAALAGKYDMINIKLDKTGGLTEALALRDTARHKGFGIMVGCMIGSSLAMAPAMLVAQGADLVDLDAPLLLARDREVSLRYDDKYVYPPLTQLWG